MSTPITSKIKRSPLTKYSASALKQTDPPLGKEVKVGGTLEGKKSNKKVDSVKTEKKINYPKDEQVCSAQYKAKTGKGGPGSKECQAWQDAPAAQKKRAETKVTETCPPGSTGTPPNCTEQTQGDDVDYDVTLMQKNEGTILQPYERARLTRNTKQTNRDVRRSKIKLAKNKRKLEKMAKRGKTSGSRYDRLTAKKEENESELAVNETAAANQALAVESGGKQGSKYKKKDTIVTQGQRGPEQQDADARNAAIREKRKADRAAKAAADKDATDKANKVADDDAKKKEAKKNNITTGEKGLGVADPAAVNLSGGFGDTLDLYASTDYSSPFQKRRGYSMKAKSPATKKLQGAQNTLPQFLQDSIKATPGKMRTALKKGYFKNK
jgi:hypothetical protein